MGHLQAQPLRGGGAHRLAGFLVAAQIVTLPGGGGRRGVQVLPKARGVPSLCTGGREQARAGPKSHGRALLNHSYLGAPSAFAGCCWCSDE